LKVASFHVKATQAQSIRWKRAADSEGLASVGQWLARAADAHLEHRARAGLPLPLAWAKGTVQTRLLDGREVDLRGWVAPPFGIYRGDSAGPKAVGAHLYTLVYIPGRRQIATFRYISQCKSLGSDLARLWVRWGGGEPAEDPGPVLSRHLGGER
jgi:hypothetical protein